MRISDWSSDVCSSDLPRPNLALPPAAAGSRRCRWQGNAVSGKARPDIRQRQDRPKGQMGRPDGARGRRPPLSKAFACNFAQAYEAAARPQSVVDMRVARSLTSLSSAERLCHYPEGWSKTTAVENEDRKSTRLNSSH